MPSKSDLSAFKQPQKTHKRILPSNDGMVDAKPARGPITGKKPGPGPKPKHTKQDKRVGLSLTEEEAEKLAAKTQGGLIKEATVIHKFLRDHGFFD